MKTHDTIVMALKDGKITFFQTFDYTTQKVDAQAALTFVQELGGGWQISHVGHYELSNTHGGANLIFDIKIPE